MTKSELLLGRLIEERLAGADVEAVDARIRGFFEEEWCVVFTDMADFSDRSVSLGIVPFLCQIHELKRMARPVIEGHGGFIIKAFADTFVILFRRAPDAIACLVELQRKLAAFNERRVPQERLELGAGVGFGRVLKIGDEDVYGVEVNCAARLGEDLAKPYEILVTDSARAGLLHLPGVRFEPIDRGTPFPAFRAIYDLHVR